MLSDPSELTLAVLKRKWTATLLLHLQSGPHRYSELRRRIPQVSDKVLSARLQELTRCELVLRQRVGEGTAAPRYCLSCAGRSLAHSLAPLSAWGVQHLYLFRTPVNRKPSTG
jgi:DNA-binding HxlR family transcriptional regulator